MSETSEPVLSERAIRLKRLRFRAQHRGFKEADLVLGRFAERHLAALDDAELDAFEALLGVPDHDFYEWFVGRQPLPPRFDTPLFRRIKAERYDTP